jgi:hypothetical protein
LSKFSSSSFFGFTILLQSSWANFQPVADRNISVNNMLNMRWWIAWPWCNDRCTSYLHWHDASSYFELEVTRLHLSISITRYLNYVTK